MALGEEKSKKDSFFLFFHARGMFVPFSSRHISLPFSEKDVAIFWFFRKKFRGHCHTFGSFFGQRAYPEAVYRIVSFQNKTFLGEEKNGNDHLFLFFRVNDVFIPFPSTVAV